MNTEVNSFEEEISKLRRVKLVSKIMDPKEIQVLDANTGILIPEVQAISWGVSIDDVCLIGTMISLILDESGNFSTTELGEIQEKTEEVVIESIHIG